MKLLRIAAAALLALSWVTSADADASREAAELTAVAVEERWRGLDVDLALSRAVPWRVFTLDRPRRLGVELRGVNPSGDVVAQVTGGNASGVGVQVREGGWTRVEVALARPLAVEEAGMAVDDATGTASLRIRLVATDDASFAARSRVEAPADAGALGAPEDDGLIVALDPGHGGFDPGAERGGLREADLMLALAQEVAAALREAGLEAVLTRSDDSFVGLEERIARARDAGAAVLVSLHADSLEEDEASGASVYLLTHEAVAQASGRMVERNAGTDLLAGQDLTGQDDAVAAALLDLARADTTVRSERLGQILVQSLGEAGVAVNSRPLRRAALAVLLAADVPGVLLETGFLSDDTDRARLATPEGRAPLVRAVVAALRTWSEAEAAAAPPLGR